MLGFSFVDKKQNWGFRFAFAGSLALAAFFGAMLIASMGHAGQQSKQQGGMAGMDMHDKNDMGDMGPSMAAMAGHMYITPLRAAQPGDEAKVKQVVAERRPPWNATRITARLCRMDMRLRIRS